MIKRTLALLGVSFSLSANAIVISSGDTFQQSTSTSVDYGDVTIESGGTVLQRTDYVQTQFAQGNHVVTGGIVDADIIFDLSYSLGISGGQFNYSTNIDRLNAGASGGEISGGIFNGVVQLWRISDDTSLTISGGVFNGGLDLWAQQGDLIISGGSFSDTLWGSVSYSEGATPTTTLMGSNWALNGQALDFVGPQLNLQGMSGLLTGELEDGNAIAVQISSDSFGFNQAPLYVVNTVPLPAAVWFFGVAIVSLVGVKRRK